MPYFVLMTRLTNDAPAARGDAARRVGGAIREACAAYGRLRKWRWIESYALDSGRVHFLDVFELPDEQQAQQLAAAIRESGIAEVEVLRVTRALRAPGEDANLLSAYRGRGDAVEEASQESFPASDAPAWR